jgi:hypothetical protein
MIPVYCVATAWPRGPNFVWRRRLTPAEICWSLRAAWFPWLESFAIFFRKGFEMPRNWVVSCHGAVSMSDRQVGTSSTVKVIELIPVPPGVKFVQFVPEATLLDSGVAGWPGYNCLMQSPPDFAGVSRIPGYNVFSGVSLPNYVMSGDASWIDSNGLSASGIFVAGDTFHRDPQTYLLQPGDQYTLKQFFAYPDLQAGDTIYWLACRAWLKDGAVTSFPKAPEPPPRPARAPPPLPGGRSHSGIPTRMLSALPPGSISPMPFRKG